MAAWNVSIGKTTDGLYEVRLSIPGAFGHKYRFTRTLPPDFSDFVTGAPCAGKTRVWRRPPSSVKHDELLFCAGDIDTLKEIGARLYDSLFRFDHKGKPKDLTDVFLAARAGAPDKDEGLGFVIDLSEVPELSRVPWEALYLADGDEELLLGIDTGTNVVRHLESHSDGGLPRPVKFPIRMLVAVADTDRGLEADAEVGNIERRLNSLPRADKRYKVETLERATKAGLHRRIVKWKPHIIHFIGHGDFSDGKGVIYLHSEKAGDGRVAVNSTALRDLVRNNPPWLVVLNSCLSGTAAKADPFAGAAQNLIRANVPFVVAMQAPISDDAAIRFSEDFYESLAQGDTVATAVTCGRDGIHGLEDEGLQPELITPVLYTNGRTTRIGDLAGKDGGGKWSRVWRAIDPANQRVVGIATIVSMVAAVLALVWMSGPSDSPSPALPAPPAMAREEGIASANEAVAGGEAAGAPLLPEQYFDLPSEAHERVLPRPSPVRPAQARGPPARAMRDLALRTPGPSMRYYRPRPPRLVVPAPGSLAQGSPPAAARPRRPAMAPPANPSAVLGSGLSRGSIIGSIVGLIGRPREPRAMQIVPEPRATATPRDEEELAAATTAPAERPRDRIEARPGDDFEAWSTTGMGSGYSPADDGSAPDYALGPTDSVAAAQGREGSEDDFWAEPDIVAEFATGSVVPDWIDLSRHMAILSTPAGTALSIELIGGAGPDQPVAAPHELGLARARQVADDLRARGVPAERIAVASAAGRWPAVESQPDSVGAMDGVEARLLLGGADRILFAPNSARISLASDRSLNRIAAFARDNPDYLFVLHGHAEASERRAVALSLLRARNVEGALRRRGVDELRIRFAPFGNSRPELVARTGPNADRRVEIVLIPPEPNAPPPQPPTPP